MKRFKNILTILTLAVIALATSSCEHKELCYHHPHEVRLRVDFDWVDAPEANPEGMCVFFYSLDSDRPMRRFDFKGRMGDYITITEGRYRVICYNNDTEVCMFDAMHAFDSHFAFTREGAILEPVLGAAASRSAKVPRAKGSEDQRIVVSPDMLWGATAFDVTISDEEVTYTSVTLAQAEAGQFNPVTSPDRQIILFPHELVCTYTYEIRNVTGLQHVSRMSGTITGMAPTLALGDESLGRECVTIPYEANKGDATTIVGKFLTFGHHEENADPHRMLIYIWMNDGQKYCYGMQSDRFDVTDQVHRAPDRRHVHIIIDGLDLKTPIDDDIVDPSVDDWIEENFDIHI